MEVIELNRKCIEILKETVKIYMSECEKNKILSGILFLGKNVSSDLVGWSLMVDDHFNIDLFICSIIDTVVGKETEHINIKEIHNTLTGYRILERNDAVTRRILHWNKLF